jgi:hypothetical protein
MSRGSNIIEEVRFGFSKPQHDFLTSKEKYVAAVAGFGSGKTFVALARIIRNMLESPGIDQAYLAPTYPLIRDIFYPTIGEMLPDMGLDYKINKSEHTVSIDGLGTIFCRTMDNPETIVGWKVADAVLDEFDIIPTNKAKHVFRKVTARLRQNNPTGRINQLFVTTTPEGFKATYELFKKSPLENSQLIQMSTYSNMKNLPADYISTLRDQYPAQLIEAYLMGNFVNLTSGTVYYAFDRNKHDSFYLPRPKEALHIGMDFNINHMAGIAHIIRGNEVIAIDEFIGYRDTPDIIEAIKNTYPGHPVYVYPDASGDSDHTSAQESDITQLKGAHFMVRVGNANPLIKNRVASMNNAFEKGYYRVNTRRCQHYTEALEQQVYGPNGLPDKTSGLDHPLDAGGYFIHWRFPIKSRKVETAKVVGT